MREIVLDAIDAIRTTITRRRFVNAGAVALILILLTLALSYQFSCLKQQPHELSAKLPVYNALFSPTSKRSPSVLFDHRPTSVRFFIGPRDKATALGPGNWTVNPEIASNKENVLLVVTLICPFCSEMHVQSLPLTYYGTKRASSEAKFDFIPLRSKLANDTGSGKLAFEVTRSGMQVDYIPVDVQVVSAGTETVSTTNTVSPTSLHELAKLSESTWSRPLDLLLYVSPIRNLLQVQLQPGNKDVEALFGNKYLTADGKGDYRWFTTGMLATDFPVADRNFYGDLYATVNHDTKLKAVLAGTQQSPTGPAGDILLSDNDEKELLKPFFAAGRGMYNRLFVTGAEPDLRELMEKFRHYSRNDRPVRIRIKTDGVYLPWQILVPPGSSDIQEIWGFRYELSVAPTGIILPGPEEGPFTYQSGPLLFGRYRSADPKDVVAKLGDAENEVLQSELKIKGVTVANSRDTFLDGLQQSRSNLQMVLTFTHGLSGTVISENGDVTENSAGPRLQFAEDEFVTARGLDDLLNSIQTSEPAMFHSAPLVFLNGCETGTAGYFATTNFDFGGTFLRMGARGVLVTEAPVWSFFGYNFGVSLIKQLKAGDPVPQAVLSTRGQYLAKLHNPLGLLYTYYGGPDVTVHFQ